MQYCRLGGTAWGLGSLRSGRYNLGRHLCASSLQGRLDELTRRQDEILEAMSVGTLPGEKMDSMGKELSVLGTILDRASAWTAKKAEMKDLEEIIGLGKRDGEDGKLYKMARDEHKECHQAVLQLEREVNALLSPRNNADSKNVILEVRSCTGGEEAAIFAGEMLEMYKKFSSLQGWKFHLLHASMFTTGGIREAAGSIEGLNVFATLKYESGVHRVQRVPANDVRLHTSTMTVVVLPEPEELDIKIGTSELRFETFRASGAGGQHVNTTESAVRVTHIPTGITVSIQDERSQHMNRSKALKILRSRVYEQKREQHALELSAVRSSAIGRGGRAERIRTYNFPQNRVTDHRINYSRHGLEGMMNGNMLADFIAELKHQDTKDEEDP